MNKIFLRKQLLPVFIIFIVINTFSLVFGNFLDEHKIDHLVLIVANALLFAITLFAFALFKKSLQNPNPNVFVRSIMLSVMVKLLIIASSILIYALLAKGTVSIYAVIVSMVFYIVYTVVEVKGALQMNRQSNVKN